MQAMRTLIISVCWILLLTRATLAEKDKDDPVFDICFDQNLIGDTNYSRCTSVLHTAVDVYRAAAVSCIRIIPCKLVIGFKAPNPCEGLDLYNETQSDACGLVLLNMATVAPFMADCTGRYEDRCDKHHLLYLIKLQEAARSEQETARVASTALATKLEALGGTIGGFDDSVRAIKNTTDVISKGIKDAAKRLDATNLIVDGITDSIKDMKDAADRAASFDKIKTFVVIAILTVLMAVFAWMGWYTYLAPGAYCVMAIMLNCAHMVLHTKVLEVMNCEQLAPIFILGIPALVILPRLCYHLAHDQVMRRRIGKVVVGLALSVTPEDRMELIKAPGGPIGGGGSGFDPKSFMDQMILAYETASQSQMNRISPYHDECNNIASNDPDSFAAYGIKAAKNPASARAPRITRSRAQRTDEN